MTPETCPNCGADVPRRARACPECGACETTGWSAEAEADSLGLPDEHFDYDEFVQKEFGPAPKRPRGVRPVWWATGIAVALALIWVFFVRHFF
jgi:hypothetical protein